MAPTAGACGRCRVELTEHPVLRRQRPFRPAPRSPWQNPFVERLVGFIRRERLDHVVVWDERALRHHLRRCLIYDHEWWTHLSLDKDALVARALQLPSDVRIVAVPHVGGLHHDYDRAAA